MKRSFFVAFFFASAIAGAAPQQHTITGMWHGRVQFDMSHMPNFKNQRQKALLVQRLDKIQQASITLTLKGDHTYAQSVHMSGAGAERLSGRWSVSGSSFTMEQMVSGKYSGTPQTFTIDKNWRSFSLKKSGGPGGVDSTVTYFR